MGRGKPPATALPMTERHYRLLKQEGDKRTTLRQYYERIPILLQGSKGQSNSQVSRDLGISLNTVKSWRRRWESGYQSLIVFEKGDNGQGVSDYELLREMLKRLDDLPRSGTPKRITLAQEQQIIALACEKPRDYGVEMTTWTHEMLAKVAIARCIVESISPRYVGEILKKVQVATA